MKQLLKRTRWKYLALALVSVLVWCTVFSIRSKPKQNEQLRVLYIGEGIDTVALQSDLTALLPELKAITVTQELPRTDQSMQLLTYRQFSYDILIFSKPYCIENMGQNHFSRLTASLLAQFPAVPQYTEACEDTELTFALIPNEAARLYTYFTNKPSDGCLLFFSPESFNLGGENGKGAQADNAAIKAAQYLTEALP